MFGAYLVTPPEDLPSDALAMLAVSGETRAHALLDGLYHLLARHCSVRSHRENIMRGLTAGLVRRFGEGVVPRELRVALPGLVPSGEKPLDLQSDHP